MLKTWMMTLVLSGLATSALAGDFVTDDRYYGGYECTETAAGGVAWDKASGKWSGTGLRPDASKFVVKLLAKKLIDVDFMGENQQAMGYYVMLDEDGDSNISSGNEEKAMVTIGSLGGGFYCADGDFKMSLSNMRFMRIYSGGYLDGRDDGRDTPGIKIGECRKFE